MSVFKEAAGTFTYRQKHCEIEAGRLGGGVGGWVGEWGAEGLYFLYIIVLKQGQRKICIFSDLV